MEDGGKQQLGSIHAAQLHEYESAMHFASIVRELFTRMPQNTPLCHNLVKIAEQGFPDGDIDEDGTTIPGMTPTDICDLLGINKSLVSQAKHDDDTYNFVGEYQVSTWSDS